jgi:hypothetical protein
MASRRASAAVMRTSRGALGVGVGAELGAGAVVLVLAAVLV